MSELAVVGDQQPAAPVPSPAESNLVVWANDARQASAVARSLAPTPFIPSSLRATRTSKDEPEEQIHARTAANITAAILTGQELGLTPMAALRSVVVIQGTPAMTAVALRGLVQSRGHEIWVESSSDTRAVVCGQRRGSTRVERSVWTIERARQLGLTSKDNWRKQPEAMLVARGTSEVGRRIAADVLLGMPYSVEELADEAPETTAGTRRAQRRTAPEPVALPEPALTAPEPPRPAEPEPEREPAPEPEAVAEPPIEDEPLTPEPITRKQLTALNAALGALGYTDRHDKLRHLSEELGRPITSSADVTKDEATRLLDRIAQYEAQPKQPADEEPTSDTYVEEPPLDWQPEDGAQ